MRLIDVLERNEDGFIVIPISAITPEGKFIGGYTSEKWIREFFGSELLESELPITDENYKRLIKQSTLNWVLNWEYWKQKGILN